MIFYTIHISSSFRNNHIITITIIPYVSIKVNAFGSKSNSRINSRECDFCFFNFEKYITFKIKLHLYYTLFYQKVNYFTQDFHKILILPLYLKLCCSPCFSPKFTSYTTIKYTIIYLITIKPNIHLKYIRISS